MKLLGIINCSQDSFSGDGCTDHAENATRAAAMMAAGAWMVDVGAASTRPGAAPDDADEEIRRLSPTVELLARAGIPFSVDTVHAAVMRRALAHGAAMLNDQRALQEPGALEAAAESNALVCLMHTESVDNTTLHRPIPEGDPWPRLLSFFAERLTACDRARICRNRIILDPGFGFGKTYRQQALILRDIGRLKETFGCRVLVGLSRKRWIGALGGATDVADRLVPTLTVGTLALEYGADILRLHDVEAAAAALASYFSRNSR